MATTTERPSTVDVKGARALFDEMIDSSGKIDTRVVIERDGVVVGAFVPVADLQTLLKRDEQHAEFNRRLAEMRAPFADVPPEEIEREIEKALAEVDAERAAKRVASTGS